MVGSPLFLQPRFIRIMHTEYGFDTIIQYENEDYDEEDEMMPIDRCYRLNKHI